MERIDEPLVSIVTSMYNSERFIRETIQSVVGQTYRNWEMNIVDDNSTDNSFEIAQSYSKTDKRIKVFKLDQNHKMPYAARNFGIDRSNGKYIAFLDSDDLWHSQKLGVQIPLMEKNQWAISFTNYSKKYEGNPSKKKIIVAPNKVTYSDLLKTNSIGNLTAVYNVEKLGKVKQINHLYEDYIMWLHILKKGFEAYGIKDTLATYRVHAKSYSNNKIHMARVQWKIYRKILKLNLFQSAWYFLNYALNGIKKF